PGQVGQLHVEYHDVDRVALHPLQRLGTGTGLDDRVPGPAQPTGYDVPLRRRVVDDKHRTGLRAHDPSSGTSGRVSVNLLPTPTSLVSVSSPPSSATSRRAYGRPSPVPVTS